VTVRAQRDREEQTVLIGTALGLFAVVMTAEVLGLWFVHSAFDVGVGSATFGWTVVVAGTAAIVYLARSDTG
jgi:hypothetical protein